MEPIEISINEKPNGGEVSEDGQYIFKIYASNACDHDLEKSILIMAKLWDIETEVCLTINMATRDIYKDIYDMHKTGDNTIDIEDYPIFEALYKDCKWIVEQIESLVVEE